jgi:hypothetical protein
MLSDSAPDDFLHYLIHDLRREMDDIESLIAFVLSDGEAAVLPLENLSRKMAVQEIFELILRRKDTMNDILNLACHYVDHAQSTNR